jgi:hypothetical protein
MIQTSILVFYIPKNMQVKPLRTKVIKVIKPEAERTW